MSQETVVNQAKTLTVLNSKYTFSGNEKSSYENKTLNLDRKKLNFI